MFFCKYTIQYFNGNLNIHGYLFINVLVYIYDIIILVRHLTQPTLAQLVERKTVVFADNL